ncbi:hypothetical protein FQA39_LY00798 [Lamprigera yunnana]|nr:hypothetical protein FQA39_LY00798 [Lamprigera yunnana]
MSSYQFVNSLAQCYGQQPRAGTATDQTAHQVSSPGSDYYNPNAASASSYPPACYSPPQVGPQYHQHPYATPAPGHGLQPPMGDYTQLQPQRLTGSSTHLHHSSPGAQSPGILSAAASCKYADSTSSTGVASPQDLSTTGAPSRSTPPMSNSQTNNSATITSKNSTLTSPLSVSTSPPGKQATSSTTASQNLSSPASSTSSTSSNEKTGGSNNNSKNSQSQNPPQIYPWMKRVHLGQKESNSSYNTSASEDSVGRQH